MSFIKFISNTKSKIFNSNKRSYNISSILNNYEPDLEAGEGYYYKKLRTILELKDVLNIDLLNLNLSDLDKLLQLDMLDLDMLELNALEFKNTLEFNSTSQYDLEMGDKSIIYEKVKIEKDNPYFINTFNKLFCNIVWVVSIS